MNREQIINQYISVYEGHVMEKEELKIMLNGFADDIVNNLQPSLPDNLDEAAEEYLKYHKLETASITKLSMYRSLAFKAGAEWQKEHQFCPDAPKGKSVGSNFSSSHKDKNLDEIAQDYVDSVKEYNPKPTWDLMQTAVCYGYYYRIPQPAWISVDDFLPKVDEEVIVLTDDLGTAPIYKIAFGHIVDRMHCSDYNDWNIPGVKFWMLCPTIPLQPEPKEIGEAIDVAIEVLPKEEAEEASLDEAAKTNAKLNMTRTKLELNEIETLTHLVRAKAVEPGNFQGLYKNILSKLNKMFDEEYAERERKEEKK